MRTAIVGALVLASCTPATVTPRELTQPAAMPSDDPKVSPRPTPATSRSRPHKNHKKYKNLYSGSCLATWYDYDEPRTTASGRAFNPGALEAASVIAIAPGVLIPFGSIVRVTHDSRSVDVRIVDRGPFGPGRCLDLTPAAFRRLSPLSAGVIEVDWRRIA
jgi:rare lipoprotein A